MGEIDIDGLWKVFEDDSGEIVAVDDLDLEIEDGEFLVLVGPSGCGKSTTLRCIAGLEKATEGTIRLGENDITNKRSQDRDIAMVFQNYALYPHMTAEENMAFGLRMNSDLPESEIEERVTDAAEMMGIEDLLDDKPGELSGGQQQRVALGRAIVRDPEVFLMDEPLSNLDAKLRTQMRTELQNLQQELGTTTIYVTHDQTEAMTMSDRIAILNEGELQQVGTPLECYHEPANQFVAGFIGSPSMNFFTVDHDSTAQVLQHGEFDYHLSESMSSELEKDGTMVLGIRPDDIELSSQRDSQNAISIEVSVVEPLGDLTYVYFEIGVGGKSYTATVDGEITIEEADSLFMEFPEERIHLFDAETGDVLKNREYSEKTKLKV